jgi:S-adenosylmethionine decarboxylase
MKPASFQPNGMHLLADLYGITPENLGDADAIERLLRHGAEVVGATILHSYFHTFGSGQGITGVVLLAESHISIHTWPEYGFAAADIFMCGNAVPQRALDVIEAALRPTRTSIQSVARGEEPNASQLPPIWNRQARSS